MVNIVNKRILLLAPKFYNYETEIKKSMVEKGAIVDIVYSEPSPTFITLVEVCSKLGLSRNFFYNFFRNRLKYQIHKKYDYIIVIDGWLINNELSLHLKKECLRESGKIVLYYWDSLAAHEKDYSRWDCFDKVFTFDREDYLTHQGKLHFLPLFYCDNYWDESNDNKEYDLYVIGSFRLNRLEFVRNIKNKNKELSIGSYLYVPRWQFVFHKIFRRKYKNINDSELEFSRLSMQEVHNIYRKCRAIIDVPASCQKGLTIRTIESLAMHKKLITTNKDIVNYDFYNPNDFFVCDSVDNLTLPNVEWFSSPYSVADEIIKKYSISNWILNLLNV